MYISISDRTFHYRDAWYGQRGLSRTEAKRRYITTLIETMHRYASQTPEALELVGELEFVWDQVRANTAPSRSASSSSAHRSVFPSSNKKTKKKSSRSSKNSNGPQGKDSRMRVLSPVSQPEAEYQRSMQALRDGRDRGNESGDGDDDVEEEEEEEGDENGDGNEDIDDYQDAVEDEYNDALDEEGEYEEEAGSGNEYASDEKNLSNGSVSEAAITPTKPKHRRKHKSGNGRGREGGGRGPGVSIIHHHHNNNNNPNTARDQVVVPRLWRRRVEQALTNMTAEVAAVREQMETRALTQRRRSGLWAWLKWLLWVTLRQILWDVAMMGLLLIWMRARGDKRVEDRLRMGWANVKNKLIGLGVFRQLSLPL